MENKIFIVGDDSGESSLSFGDLLKCVSNANAFYRAMQTDSLSDFVVNFLIGLSRSEDILLIDSDCSVEELNALGIKNFNSTSDVSSPSFSNFSELIGAIENSKSKISLFTSGTTGIPKKVSHSVSTLSKTLRRGEKYANNIWGLAYSPTHMAGLQVLLQAIFNENSIVNLFKKNKDEIFEKIDAHKITHISATPTFYRLLLSENRVCKSMERVTCGGEKSDFALHEKLSKIFPNAKINNIYASTEFGSLLISNGEFFKIPESLKNFIKIEDNFLKVHKCLLGDFDKSIEGDFYNTGDIVEFCNEQRDTFKFVTRSLNILNVGGYKVNLEEVEEALRCLCEIREARAYGRKNSVLGNILCAEVMPVDGTELDVMDIRKKLATKLQSYKIPRLINIVDNIQSTKTGKLKR